MNAQFQQLFGQLFSDVEFTTTSNLKLLPPTFSMGEITQDSTSINGYFSAYNFIINISGDISSNTYVSGEEVLITFSGNFNALRVEVYFTVELTLSTTIETGTYAEPISFNFSEVLWLAKDIGLLQWQVIASSSEYAINENVLLQIESTNAMDPVFANESFIGDNWYFVPELGNINKTYADSSWYYMENFGFTYIPDVNENGEIYFYDPIASAWYYTTQDIYPFVYNLIYGASEQIDRVESTSDAHVVLDVATDVVYVYTKPSSTVKTPL